MIAYAVTTHWRFPVVKWSSRPMLGSATFAIAASRIVMKNAVPTTAKARQRFGFGTAVLMGSPRAVADGESS